MWRCFNCGSENNYVMKCSNCGFHLKDRDNVTKADGFAPIMGEDAYVTFKSFGDGTCSVDGMTVQIPTVPAASAESTSFDDDFSDDESVKPSLGHRAFMASLRLVTGASIVTVLSILTFFLVVFVKACTG